MGASSPIELAAEMVAVFVSNNPLPRSELPALIHALHATMTRLAGEQSSARPKSSQRRPRCQFEDRSRRTF